MKKILLTLAIALLAGNSLFAQLPPDSVLRRYAAGMLMVGFKGDSVTEDCDAARYVRDLKVGAIVLFDIDLTGDATLGSRNITSKERLTRMTAQLRAWADYPLLIATDQEGGKVARLKPQYGFLPTVTAEYLGTVNQEDTTRYYAARLSREMRESGVNVNLAPVVDVLNHDCAAVGHFMRCFSTDPQLIARHAGWFIDESHRQGVLCTLKHFPGHGNAIDDSHYGFVDVTNGWTAAELEPFRILIDAYYQRRMIFSPGFRTIQPKVSCVASPPFTVKCARSADARHFDVPMRRRFAPASPTTDLTRPSLNIRFHLLKHCAHSSEPSLCPSSFMISLRCSRAWKMSSIMTANGKLLSCTDLVQFPPSERNTVTSGVRGKRLSNSRLAIFPNGSHRCVVAT